jgi:hypothetical protein
MQTDSRPTATEDTLEPEFSLYDVIQFLKRHRLVLAIGLVSGIILGGMAGCFLSKEQAVITLDNSNTVSPISYSEWINVSGLLPYLATSAIDVLKAEGKDVREMEYLTKKKWWDKNLKPTFAFDKNTSKDLGAIPEGMKADYGRILRVTVQAEAKKTAEAYRRVDEATQMIRRSGIQFRIKSTLESYRVLSLQADQAIASLMTQNTIDADYLVKDREALNALIAFNTQEINSRIASMNRVINDTNAVGSGNRNVFNIRGGETPEIPLDAKLNEIKLALHEKEIQRLKAADQKSQNEVLKGFLEQAEPIVKSGLTLDPPHTLDQLLELEKTMRSQIPESDGIRIAKLNTIRGDLLAIQLTFINQLSVISRSVESINRISVGILGGGIGGALMALLGAWLISLYRVSAGREPTASV